jgi:putative aldouronate transport system substrate-binding protein
MKKLLAILVVVSILLGCSMSLAEGPQQVNILYIDATGFKYDNQLAIFDRWEKDCNIKLNRQTVPESEFGTKFGALCAGGNLPDVTTHIASLDSANEAGTQGLLLPISDYLDEMPHVKAMLEEFPEEAELLKAADGKIYKIPTVKMSDVNTQGFCIRADVLKANGINADDIKTMDDLFNALMVLKEANGGKAVYGIRSGSNLTEFTYFARAFGVYSVDFIGNIQYNNETSKYEYPIESQNLKDAVAYFAKLYENGILPADCMTMSDQQWDAANKANELFFFVDNCPNLPNFNQSLWNMGVKDADYKCIMTPSYNATEFPWKAGRQLDSSWGFVIGANSKSLKGTFAYLDWLYNKDNLEYLVFGIEGETCAHDENGRLVNTMSGEEGTKLNTEKYGFGMNWNWCVYRPAFPYLQWDKTALVYYPDTATQSVIAQYESVLKNVYLLPPDPVLTFTEDQSDDLKDYKTPIDTYIQENIASFILGQKTMDQWDAFLEGFNAMNPGRVIDIFNASLNN